MPLPKAYDAEWRPPSDDEEDDDYGDPPSSIPASPIHQYPGSQSGIPPGASTRPTAEVPVDWAKTNHVSMKAPQLLPQGKAVAQNFATNTNPAFAFPIAASTSSSNNSAHGEIGHHRQTSSKALSSDAETIILIKPRSDKDADPRRCFSQEIQSPTERPQTCIDSMSRQSSSSYSEHPSATPIWPVVTGPTSQSAVRPSAPAALQPTAASSKNPTPNARTLTLPVKSTVRLSSTLPPASPGGQTPPVVSQGSLFSELDALDKEEEEEEEEAQKSWGQRVFEKFRSQALFVAQEVWEPALVWDPKDEGAKQWTMVFVISLLVAFALDPMYLFVASAHKTYLCLYIDWSYVVVLSAGKSVVTLFYLANMLLQFHTSFKEPLTRTRFYPWSPTRPPSPHAGKWITDVREIRANYISGWFLLDCFAVLPLREVEACLAPAVINQASSLVLLLRLLIFLQYVPRAARLWPLLGSSSESGMLFESAWASFVLNLFMYIMASHLVGATWYWLAVQRFSQCLIDTCLMESASLGCNMSYLSCGRSVGTTPDWLQRQMWASTSKALINCEWAFNHTPDFFNYGIFNLAVPLIFSQQELSKYLYALQWGFTAISTLGGSSVPSEYDVEILFMFCITSSGLFLFAVLIGNIQNFLQSLTSRTFEYQLRRRDMGIWMGRRNVPLSLVTRVEELERLKWVSNQGIDESQMLTTLTEELKSEVRRHLYLDLIKKSVLFLSMEEAVLDVIFERLGQRIFTQGTVVIREGLPVSRMFFVLRGELESSTIWGGRMNHRRSVKLKNGDFFGEELLILYLERSQSQKDREKKKGSRRILPVNDEEADEIDPEVFPRSENTIVCLGPVEGFVLEAEDLEFVCKQFHKSLNRPAVQHALNQCSYHRRTHAAITLQLWYRRKLRERLGISLAHAYLAHTQGLMGNLMRSALLRKKENKSVKRGIIISRV